MLGSFGWYAYSASSIPRLGSYVILIHKQFPWPLTLPCEGMQVVAPGTLRVLLRDGHIKESEYCRVFDKAYSSSDQPGILSRIWRRIRDRS